VSTILLRTKISFKTKMQTQLALEFLNLYSSSNKETTINILVKKAITTYKGADNLPSEGCSNPESTIARRSSGFRRKSLNPELWIPT
jgi:hypothetical protein